MLWTLAQLDPQSSAAQWFWWVSWIMIIGAVAVLVIVGVGVGRRWKRRQLKAIDEDRQARRAGRSSGRVDAWAASSDRYVDHDKLPDEQEDFDRDDEREPEDDDGPIHGSAAGEADPTQEGDEEDRDPFGLFSDKPYQDPDDEDDDAFDEDEDGDGDWDDEDDKR